MAKKHARKRSISYAHQAGASSLASSLSAFDAAYQDGDYTQAMTLAEALVHTYPNSSQAHERHVNVLGQVKRFREAGEAMERVIHLTEVPNAAQWLKLALYHVMAGKAKQAVPILEKVLDEQPEHLTALVWLSRAHHQLGNGDKALTASDFAYALNPQHEEMLQWRAVILDRLARHDEAVETLQLLLSINPQRRGANNQIATLYVKEGDYQKAEFHYAKEMELGQDTSNGPAYSNLLLAVHYNPEYSADDIASKVLEWEKRFAQRSPLGRAITLKEPAKRLRIGLLSGGFRLHPVGQMTLPALSHLPIDQFELVVYSTSQAVDPLTEQFQQTVQRWEVVEGLDDNQLEQKIRDDGIDILIDMNGGGDGTRYTALSREPAPLIVKWVGGLINTTGLACFDYLISDNIETPKGGDKAYSEKLIRLPDDYICYHLPDYAPPAGVLPALSNGYITFGCLNSPAKLSPPLLAEWAILLKEVPNSKLLLRGMQFESARYRDKIVGTLAEHGIETDRLIMEKGAPHKEFLATYQRIDIALDTWPYSGGLTTCEALMMGVPVVTRVGPTFAGRHSATHLINAGLSELVTDSWEAFRLRAKELANDLPNLAVIRAALRTILINSPICNGPRFANHLTTALRAIWQRHCEGKTPAALTFNKGGQARFEDEAIPVRLPEHLRMASEGFDWPLESTVTVLDNGANLARRDDAEQLLGTGYIALLTFDPTSELKHADSLAQYGEIQHFPQVTLGDGQPVSLRADGTSLSVLADQPESGEPTLIPSISLDSIEGLPGIDMLALDDCHDSLSILTHGEKALRNTLLIQARIRFNPSHANQPDLSQLIHWAVQHGFRFYRLNNAEYRSYLPESIPASQRQASELVQADVLFLPSQERMSQLNDNQRAKLAFLLHTLYKVQDVTYSLLLQRNPLEADNYLQTEQLIGKESLHKKDLQNEKTTINLAGKTTLAWKGITNHSSFRCKTGGSEELTNSTTALDNESASIHNTLKDTKRFIHICFNNMHVQPLVEKLKSGDATAGFTHQILVNKEQSIQGYNVDLSNNPNAFYFDQRTQLDEVIEQCLKDDVVGVLFHGLFFDWQKQILEAIGKVKKVTWVIWGGDLYNPIKNNSKLASVDPYVSYVATFDESEHEFFSKYYNKKEHITFKYGFSFEDYNKEHYKENLIIVGNSGDPSNMHLELLENLAAKSDISNYQLVLPISYNGSPQYIENLKKLSTSLGLKTLFLEKMLPKSEYLDIVSRAKLFISAHNRQQGLGNITSAIFYKTTVIVKKEIEIGNRKELNPTWQHLVNKNGLILTSHEDFLITTSVQQNLREEHQNKHNKSCIIKAYGNNKISELYASAFQKLAN